MTQTPVSSSYPYPPDTEPKVDRQAALDKPRGYGRARLKLGMATVGLWVCVCVIGLWFDLPGRLAAIVSELGSSSAALGFAVEAMALLALVVGYGLLHAPSDWLGGYLLPRRYGRQHTSLRAYAQTWARGVIVYGLLLLMVALLFTLGGFLAGALGTLVVGGLLAVLLLALRWPLARLVAALPVQESTRKEGAVAIARRVRVDASDEGFTGGIAGLLRPKYVLIPSHWEQGLTEAQCATALQRRDLAVETGAWQRGRLTALAFTGVGLLIALWLTDTTRLGTAAGTLELSLWFTLWSFAGLLGLPSLSRVGVYAIDANLRDRSVDEQDFEDALRQLDAWQDDEPQRPGLVEAIFHPVPSLANRLRSQRPKGSVGCWDSARTSVFLGIAGLSLLGRAVHCNCGRPSLWVYLPTD